MGKRGNVAPNTSSGLPPRIRIAVTVLITALWGASVVAEMLSAAYDPPRGLNEAFTAVVMYLFAKQQQADREKGNDDD